MGHTPETTRQAVWEIDEETEEPVRLRSDVVYR